MATKQPVKGEVPFTGTFGRRIYEHIFEGWQGPRPERHHAFIDVKDFPPCWYGLDLTVEGEAKVKELAVLKLKKALENRAKRRKSRSVVEKE